MQKFSIKISQNKAKICLGRKLPLRVPCCNKKIQRNKSNLIAKMDLGDHFTDRKATTNGFVNGRESVDTPLSLREQLHRRGLRFCLQTDSDKFAHDM